jgi:hypothetical protein
VPYPSGYMAASSAPRDQGVQSLSIPPTMTLRGFLDARRAERTALTLEEAIATIVPLCLDLQARHAAGERLYVHPSCVEPGPDGLARINRKRSLVPIDARDRACTAPELVASLEPGGARASVFSIGAILYECVTGKPIGPGMRRPQEVNPSLPDTLEMVLAKALVSDPAHRPDDLGALASAMHHLAPMKSVHPPEVDESKLDHGSDFEVDIRLSMLPPHEVNHRAQPPSHARVEVGPYGAAIPAAPLSHPRPGAAAMQERLARLKQRLESDPRPRYVVNKDRMDHGPFSAVELLQQIASNSFTADDTLRDELSGQSRPINEWEEFSPFAQQAGLKREIVAEKKAVARVERAEKKAGFAKSTIGIFFVLVILAGAGYWFKQVRGSRNDDVDVADDSTLDLSLDGGSIRGQKHRGAGRAGGGGGGGGGGGPGGMSYEAALAANPQQIDMNGHATGPDLTDGQLAGPMRNATFLSACGAPESMHVTVRVAVKMGRAIGVSVYTTPPNSGVASCVDHSVRGLAWPVNQKMDSFTTTY